MFLLENNRIFTNDRMFQIEYKKPLEDWLEGEWSSYYCEYNSMVELYSGSLTKCITSIKKYKSKIQDRS